MRAAQVTMQRRHFELVAETLKASRLSPDARETIAREFAWALSTTNPQFKPDRFLKACGVGEG